jgi:hypothetical protein
MNHRRIVLAVALAVTASLCFVPMSSQATGAPDHLAASAGSCSHSLDAGAVPPVAAPKCIPCSVNHPCVNPLTVCTYSGSATHGCCLGYAGQN